MSLYSEISKTLPYLKSIRKIEKYFSVDVLFPTTWKLPSSYVDESKVMEQNSTEPNKRQFSFVSNINEKDLDDTISNVEKIVKYNLEREEKEKLFKQKIQDLKSVFESKNLESLKKLDFTIPPDEIEYPYDEDEITLNDDDEQRETGRLVSEGTEEG